MICWGLSSACFHREPQSPTIGCFWDFVYDGRRICIRTTEGLSHPTNTHARNVWALSSGRYALIITTDIFLLSRQLCQAELIFSFS